MHGRRFHQEADSDVQFTFHGIKIRRLLTNNELDAPRACATSESSSTMQGDNSDASSVSSPPSQHDGHGPVL